MVYRWRTQDERQVNERRLTMRDLGCPEYRWVPVVDGSGKRRLEMRWQLSGPVTAIPSAPVSRAA